MRWFLALIAAIMTLLAAPVGAQRRYSVADFDRVVVEGPYRVTLTVGRPSSASATGSPRALDGVTVDVQGTTLRIRRNRSAWGGAPGAAAEPAAITLTTRNLRSARVLGTGSVEIAGAKGLRVDLSVEGSGQLRATDLKADALSAGLRGSGSLDLAGTAGILTADIQGAGSVNGAALVADTLTLLAATSGDIALTARRAATVTANGVGRIAIGGTPACTLRGPSAAEISCGRPR
jgi:hypothetical protein